MEFEVIKQHGRVPRWRLRDQDTGEIVPFAPGKVRLPPTTAENRRVREAVDKVLTRLALERRAASGG